LLHTPDPIAQRVPVAVEPLGGPLPLAVLLYERFQRSHQFTSIVSFSGLDGPEDRVTEQPQGLVVLQRQQQLERAQLLVGGDLGPARSGARGGPVCVVAVGVRRARRSVAVA